jgi:hypothetical protein
MPLVGFEPIIPAFERAKTVHASDRAATVIGIMCMGIVKYGGLDGLIVKVKCAADCI